MKYRILTFIDTFSFKSVGGAGRVFFEVNKILVKHGHSVSAICRTQGDIGDKENIEGIDFHTYKDTEGSQLKKFQHYKSEINKLAPPLIKENKPDLIIIHSASAAPGLVDLPAAKNIPILYYFHSPWNLEYDINVERHKWGKFTLKGFTCSFLSNIRKTHDWEHLAQSAGVINLSEYMQCTMLEQHPDLDIPMCISPGGANIKRFFPADESEREVLRKKFNLPKDDFLLITSRRLVRRTSVDILIEAFAKAKDKLKKPTTLVIVGKGPMKKELENLAKALSVDDKIIFTGFVDEEDFPEYYRCCDLFIMPSQQLEGFGLSTVEAMACGIPAIGTDIGGTPEILSKFDPSLIIKGSDETVIAEKICDYINTFPHEELKSKAHHCLMDNFTWEKHTDRLEKFIEDILNNKNS